MAKRQNLTQPLVDRLKDPGRYPDTGQRGLALIVGKKPGLQKSYIVRRQDHNLIDVPVGKHPEMKLEGARKRVEEMIAAVLNGEDVRTRNNGAARSEFSGPTRPGQTPKFGARAIKVIKQASSHTSEATIIKKEKLGEKIFQTNFGYTC